MLLYLLHLLGGHPLSLGRALNLFLYVKIKSVFRKSNLKPIGVIHVFVRLLVVCIFVKHDVVLARRDAKGKIFAFLVGLERIFLAVVGIGEYDNSIRDRIGHPYKCP